MSGRRPYGVLDGVVLVEDATGTTIRREPVNLAGHSTPAMGWWNAPNDGVRRNGYVFLLLQQLPSLGRSYILVSSS